MEKEARQRGFLADLKSQSTFPMSSEAWDALVDRWDLTGEDLKQIQQVAQGHLGRFFRHLEVQAWEEAQTEADQARKVAPRNAKLLKEILEEASGLPAEHQGFYHKIAQQFGRLNPGPQEAAWLKKHFPGALKAQVKFPPWLGRGLIIFTALAGLVLGLWVLAPWLQGVPTQRISAKSSSQAVEVVLDPRGLKATWDLDTNKLQAVEDKTYLQLRGRLRFPELTLTELKAQVTLSDPQGQPLAQKEVDLLRLDQAPLPPQAALPWTFTQDVTPWAGTLKTVTVTLISHSKAAQLTPTQKFLSLTNPEALPTGTQLTIEVLNSTWEKDVSRFVHRVDLLVTNAGSRPLKVLILEAQWNTPEGQGLQIRSLRLVTQNHSPLGPGSSLTYRVREDFSLQTWEGPEDRPPVITLSLKDLE